MKRRPAPGVAGIDIGTIRGFKVRFHLYTVPGQVFYDASRKLILKGVDGVVFVADGKIDGELVDPTSDEIFERMKHLGH